MVETNPATHRLRPAVPGDAPVIVRLLATVAAEGTLGLSPADLDERREAQRLASLDLRQACALVAEIDGGISGAAIAVRGSDASTAHTASVALWVAASARRRGAGRLLLRGLQAWAGSAGVRKLCAGVLRHNDAALALFHSSGYLLEGIRRGQVAVGDGFADEVLFGLALVAATGEGGGVR